MNVLHEHIETHPDFKLVSDARELIDPETMESNEITIAEIRALETKAGKPIRDFEWDTPSGKTKISEMDTETLLQVAKRCIQRANIYADKVNFFLNVLEIAESHAEHKGIQLPDTLEEVQAAIDKMAAGPSTPHRERLASTFEPSKEFIEEMSKHVVPVESLTNQE